MKKKNAIYKRKKIMKLGVQKFKIILFLNISKVVSLQTNRFNKKQRKKKLKK